MINPAVFFGDAISFDISWNAHNTTSSATGYHYWLPLCQPNHQGWWRCKERRVKPYALIGEMPSNFLPS